MPQSCRIFHNVSQCILSNAFFQLILNYTAGRQTHEPTWLHDRVWSQTRNLLITTKRHSHYITTAH